MTFLVLFIQEFIKRDKIVVTKVPLNCYSHIDGQLYQPVMLQEFSSKQCVQIGVTVEVLTIPVGFERPCQ